MQALEQSSLQLLSYNDDFNIRREKDVKNLFKHQVLVNVPAKKYLLFTWDHGCPYGIFNNALPGTNEQRLTVSVESIKRSASRFVFFREHHFVKQQTGKKISFIDTDEEDKATQAQMLTTTEIKNAIAYAFGDKLIDVFVTMNCFTNYFSFGYELRNHVRFFVAPETSISLHGFNYPAIFQELNHHLTCSPEEIAGVVVESFPYKIYPANVPIQDRGYKKAIYANDLKYYL